MDGADGRRQGEQVTESNRFLKIGGSIHVGQPAISGTIERVRGPPRLFPHKGEGRAASVVRKSGFVRRKKHGSAASRVTMVHSVVPDDDTRARETG